MLIGSRPSAASPLQATAVAVLAPLAATVLGLPFQGVDAVVPTLLYLLAVVAASAFGRAWSGPVAALLSFVGLNFLFTPPIHTLQVDKVEDLVALGVFLAVSVIVGMLLSRALRERERVERREQEAELSHRLALSLRAGESSEETVRTFAVALLAHFGLERCEIVAADPAISVKVPTGTRHEPDGPSFEVEFPRGGRLRVVRGTGGTSFSRDEEEILRGMADQLASGLERARLDEEVHRARVDAEANQARAALFSSVTHDLRTPLASIKAAISSLLHEDVSFTETERRDLLETVREETDRLDRLVGNLMDLSRDRAGVLTPTKVPTSIEEVIDSVLARMRGQLARFRLKTMIRADLPDVSVDPMQMDQVLTNLLENSAHFAPAGSEIAVAAARAGEELQVKVVDHGPGIPQGERERVFDAFHSIGGSGTGLGLAITRAIVESHGGRIWAEATPGGGATLVFELPLTEAN